MISVAAFVVMVFTDLYIIAWVFFVVAPRARICHASCVRNAAQPTHPACALPLGLSAGLCVCVCCSTIHQPSMERPHTELFSLFFSSFLQTFKTFSLTISMRWCNHRRNEAHLVSPFLLHRVHRLCVCVCVCVSMFMSVCRYPTSSRKVEKKPKSRHHTQRNKGYRRAAMASHTSTLFPSVPSQTHIRSAHRQRHNSLVYC